MLTITYLDHSGFLVETETAALIFDYFTDSPKSGTLQEGVIDPASLQEKKVYVFVSHHHHDHYNPVVLQWKQVLPQITYLFSDDVPFAEEAVMMVPNQTYELENLTVQTLRSTDEGLAFLVTIDEYRIYHAGDLNWWHWEGEEETWNEEMARAYQQELTSLEGIDIDVAFLPVDPRLGDAYLYGMDYAMTHLNIQHVIPMHFWGKETILKRLLSDEKTIRYRNKIHCFSKRGIQRIIK